MTDTDTRFPTYQVVDGFAGPGGWSLACARLGLKEIGIETDKSAHLTRRAAGFHTIRASVADLGPANFPSAVGKIDSPPCQTFSVAGKGAGRKALDTVLAAVESMAHGIRYPLTEWEDARTGLVLEPLRWHLEAHRLGQPYRWIALEQVPTVLPVWHAYAEVLENLGYSVAVGNLHAEQYGVPQTRKRAILIASLDREVSLPTPTHSRYHTRSPQRLDPDALPWVSMAEALGWDIKEGEVTVTGSMGKPKTHHPDGTRAGGDHAYDPTLRPAYTMTGLSQGVVTIAGGGTETHLSRCQLTSDTAPAPTVLGHDGHPRGGFQFVQSAQHNATRRSVGEPAPTITAAHDSAERRWEGVRFGNQDHSAVRTPDQPAATIRYGERANALDWVQARNSGPEAARDPRPVSDAPSYTVRANGSGSHPSGVEWVHERPATTVVGSFSPETIAAPGYRVSEADGSRQNAPGSVRVSVQEAGILQSFPWAYPWQGSKTKQYQQVGNAIPPLLAEAVLRAVI